MKTFRHVLKQSIVSFIFLLLFYLIFTSPIQAQTTSLSIWPPLLDTVIQPGKAITQVFRLKNLGDNTTITASIVPFEPVGEQGQVQLSTTPSPALSYFSLQNANLDLPATISLMAGQSQDFVLKIKVPDSAPPADYYFTFLFSSDTKGLLSGSGSRALASIGANILLTISPTGQTSPIAKFEEFRLQNHSFFNLPWPLFDSFSPLSFLVRVKNTGSSRFKAVGQIEIKNTFNRTLTTLPFREDNVLAGSIRQLQTTKNWQTFFPLGRYTAIASLTPQNSVNTITQTLHFYVLPYKLLLALGLIVLFYYLYLTHKKSA